MNTKDEWNGVERRLDAALSNRSPLILSLISTVIAIVALILAFKLIGDRLTFIQESRQRSAIDACYKWRQVVIYATRSTGHNVEEAKRFLIRVGLGDCNAYGLEVRHSR